LSYRRNRMIICIKKMPHWRGKPSAITKKYGKWMD